MGIFSSAASLFGFETSSDQNGKDKDVVEPGSKATVLVIDDDNQFLEAMRALLGEAGYGVLTSTTGPKGLDMLRYGPRDLGVVVLDFNMPRFNGADTLEYLRKLNDQIKVVAVSGLKVNELPPGFRQNVDRFVSKPFSNSELLAAIKEVLTGNTEAEPAASA